jgi:hypothetical protein
MRFILIGAALFAVAPIAAQAQPYPYSQTPAAVAASTPITPLSWSYDPYTSGMAPCPQGMHGDLQTCAQKMPPTYGQPSYWPVQR